jgi:hypothetical protein
VTDPADRRRRGGGRAPAVLLALLFLAVIGSAAGYVAGRQVQERQAAQQSGNTDPAAGNGQPAVATPTRLPGTHCPTVSERNAKTQLIQVLYIETYRSRAWICKDSTGGFWYQGHNKSGDIDSDQYGILLPDVRDKGDGSYVATNITSTGTTTYHVSRTGLTIEAPGPAIPPEPAVTAQSG